MKLGNHTGIVGIPNQDMAMWETMGPIADRSRERLGASDVAIVAISSHHGRGGSRAANGGPAIGTGSRSIPHVKLRSFEGIVPKTTHWTTLNVAPGKSSRRPRRQRSSEAFALTRPGGRRHTAPHKPA